MGVTLASFQSGGTSPVGHIDGYISETLIGIKIGDLE